MAPHGGAIQIEQLVPGLFVLLGCRKRLWGVLIPGFFTTFPSFNYQHCPWGKFSDAFENGQRRRRIAEAQEEVERDGIDIRGTGFRRLDGADLRAESKPAIPD